MGFLSNLFKDKKKDNSRSTSEHEHHHSHNDASLEGKAAETIPQQPEKATTPKAPSPHAHATSHAEHSKDIPRHHNEQLPPPQPGAADAAPPSQPIPQAPQHSHHPVPEQPNPNAHPEQNRQRRTQAPPRSQERLRPAYCYTGGEFSETISREEAMLAKQYNFAATEDRARAEATLSATRRNVTQPTAAPNSNANTSRNEEFDSLFSQFMHGTS